MPTWLAMFPHHMRDVPGGLEQSLQIRPQFTVIKGKFSLP